MKKMRNGGGGRERIGGFSRNEKGRKRRTGERGKKRKKGREGEKEGRRAKKSKERKVWNCQCMI